MGTVYRARDLKTEREVALKVVQLAGLPEARRERFRREATQSARLDHANVVKVFAYHEDDQRAWIASQLVEGDTLAQALRRAPRSRRVDWIVELADALGAVHAAGLVHRDVKPENALIDERGHLRLTDFGVSLAVDEAQRLTTTGGIVGTMVYLAPEQARADRELGPQADVWAAGVILYEALTGAHPFEGGDLAQVLVRIAGARVERPTSVSADVPLPLEAVCLRALSADPGERYADGAQLAQALREALDAQEPGPRLLLPLAIFISSAAMAALAATLSLGMRGDPAERGGGGPPPGVVTARPPVPHPIEQPAPRTPEALEADGLACFAQETYDPVQGLELLSRANTPAALAALGRWLRLGVGAQAPDPARAEDCLRRASQAGVVTAKRELAFMLLADEVPERRPDEARLLLREASREGDALAASLIDAERVAIEWTEQLLQNNQGLRSLVLDQAAKRALTGRGGPPSALRAHALWKRSIEAGAPAGHLPLAEVHASAFHDPAGVVTWALRAAEAVPENESRCLNLILDRMSDHLSANDPGFVARFARWCQRGRALNSATAYFDSGVLLSDGYLPTPDLRQARRYFQRSAELAKPEGRLRYARILKNGLGGPRDGPGAIHWAELAIETDLPQARGIIVDVLLNKSLPPTDPARAISVLREWDAVDQKPAVRYKLARTLCKYGSATEWQEGLDLLETLGDFEDAEAERAKFLTRGPTRR